MLSCAEPPQQHQGHEEPSPTFQTQIHTAAQDRTCCRALTSAGAALSAPGDFRGVQRVVVLHSPHGSALGTASPHSTLLASWGRPQGVPL